MWSQLCPLYITLYLETSIYKVMFKLTGTDRIFLLNGSIRVAIRSETDISSILTKHSIPFMKLKVLLYHLEMTHRYFEF
jgi:hypothetical protein